MSSLKQRGRPPKLSPSDTDIIINNPEKLTVARLAEQFRVSVTRIYQIRAKWNKTPKQLELPLEEAKADDNGWKPTDVISV